MWVRKRLDIGFRDLAFGMLHSVLPASRAALQRRLEADGARWGDCLACLSVRTGLDLLLATLELPPKSEILMSAMTIPDMARIVEHHGLLPVPVDLDPDTLGPNLASLGRAVTPASRAIVVAHLCGGRVSMAPILAEARQHGLLVIEDCAQAFDGRGYTGDPDADASLFSFGPIKTATALGGAMLRVRDRDVLDRMRARQAQYPLQTRRSYLCRLLKYTAFRALCCPGPYGMLVRAWRALGQDHDRLVNGSVRGFPGPDFFARIQQQPCAPLLAMLLRRLRTYDHRRLERRAAKGDFLTGLLAPRVLCAGRAATSHNSWVFPILVEDPGEVISALRDAGFDATQGHSMCVIPPPAERPENAANVAAEIFRSIVYLPIYPEMPDEAFRKLAESVLAVAKRPSAMEGTPATGLLAAAPMGATASPAVRCR